MKLLYTMNVWSKKGPWSTEAYNQASSIWVMNSLRNLVNVETHKMSYN